MWLSDRREILTGLAVSALTLSACGFTPVYGPEGGGQKLQGRISVSAPDDREGYVFARQFQERLGRAVDPTYQLKVSLRTTEKDQGATSTGNTTRFRLNGFANYTVTQGKTVLYKGQTRAFTGYSNTGSTVATIAAERDAYERLMIILADQVVDHLFLVAGDFPE